jgi:hypothetical protein
VRYLQHKLGVIFAVPDFRVDPKGGILDIDTSVNWLIKVSSSLLEEKTLYHNL